MSKSLALCSEGGNFAKHTDKRSGGCEGEVKEKNIKGVFNTRRKPSSIWNELNLLLIDLDISMEPGFKKWMIFNGIPISVGVIIALLIELLIL